MRSISEAVRRFSGITIGSDVNSLISTVVMGLISPSSRRLDSIETFSISSVMSEMANGLVKGFIGSILGTFDKLEQKTDGPIEKGFRMADLVTNRPSSRILTENLRYH